MADLIFTRTLSDNRYTLQVEVNNLLPSETSLITYFGEPSVDIGGTIDIADTSLFPVGYTPISAASFTVAQSTRSLPSGFPYTITLDGDNIVEAQNNLTDFQKNIENLIETTWTTFKANNNTWTISSPEVVPLP